MKFTIYLAEMIDNKELIQDIKTDSILLFSVVFDITDSNAMRAMLTVNITLIMA